MGTSEGAFGGVPSQVVRPVEHAPVQERFRFSDPQVGKFLEVRLIHFLDLEAFPIGPTPILPGQPRTR